MSEADRVFARMTTPGSLPATEDKEVLQVTSRRRGAVPGQSRVVEVVPDAHLHGADMGLDRLPGNAHIGFPGCEGDSMLMLLDARGIECSTGSACSAGVAQPSSNCWIELSRHFPSSAPSARSTSSGRERHAAL